MSLHTNIHTHVGEGLVVRISHLGSFQRAYSRAVERSARKLRYGVEVLGYIESEEGGVRREVRM